MAYVPAPGYQPIYNPPLPHATPIVGGLRPGMSIYVQGTVPHHTKSGDKIVLNSFQQGKWAKEEHKHNMPFHKGEPFELLFTITPEAYQQKGADIALHFNPRFDSGDKIVLNSFQQGKWAKEEHKHNMPFHKGEPFELLFTITPEAYQIMVNRTPCYDFRHRIPPEHVQVVDVDGDLELQSLNVIGGGMMESGLDNTSPLPVPSGTLVSFLQGMYYPQPGMHMMAGPASFHPMMAGPASFHPQVPYVANFPGGLTPKKTVVVKGLVPQGAKSFRINFKMGYSKDIALHINPRLNEKTVVRNSLLNGQWGPEERELPHNPFQPGQYFDLSIRCGNKRFKVFANGQPLFNYSHRFHNFQQIDTLEINGDVVLSYVQF
ncbi:Galectin-4 [Chelonia mydas]|uniref:Galectin n=1 Tax=Chelonia mydas TaxID=8469 RepID=M7ARA3_CHEMY|nr:Galectin-4 [Chelonia mydas]